MASYGSRIRSITTAEINRVLREGGYGRWAYFVDEAVDKVGVITANETDFAAYEVDDTPDPKLHEFGHEKIVDLLGTPDPELLVLTAGENDFEAVIFNDPMAVQDDDFVSNFNYDTLHDWQSFLGQHGLQRAPEVQSGLKKKVVMGAFIVLILIFVVIAVLNMRTAP